MIQSNNLDQSAPRIETDLNCSQKVINPSLSQKASSLENLITVSHRKWQANR